MTSGVQDEVMAHPCPRATSQLRRAFFAQAAEPAIRYGVAFDRLVEHIHEATDHRPHLTMPTIRRVDDLVHAVACVDGIELAWCDLVERHERTLVRACQTQLDATEAITCVRRFFGQLRRHTHSASGPQHLSLRSFVGTCSLRRWLRDRMFGWLSRSTARHRVAWQPHLTPRPVAAPRLGWDQSCGASR